VKTKMSSEKVQWLRWCGEPEDRVNVLPVCFTSLYRQVGNRQGPTTARTQPVHNTCV